MSKAKTKAATRSKSAGQKPAASAAASTTPKATAPRAGGSGRRPAGTPTVGKPVPAKKSRKPTAKAAAKPAARAAAEPAPMATAKRSAKAITKPAAKPTRRRAAAAPRQSRSAAAPPVVVPEGDAVAAEESAAAVGGDLKFQVSDGLRLHYQVWRPEGKPQRLVILVHGFADHSGRFSYLVPHLVERGAVVYAYDQRGQGRSAGKTGHVMKFQRLVDDLDAFVLMATQREAGVKSFLYAHSTGAIAALHYLYEKPLAVDGTVLSAPCLMLTFEPPKWKSTLGKTISSVVPSFTMQAGFDPSTVSRDEEVVATNRSDPLVSQKMTARFYTEVYLKAMPAALDRIDQLKTPYLVLQGSEDRLVSPKVADEFERRAASHGIVKRYEGGYHESHNDVHREQVFADVDAWLAAGGPRPKAART